MKLIGHEKEKALIRKYILQHYDSLSLLYEGKDCIGKKLIALYTGRLFLCDKKEDFGCGACNDCKLVNNLISNVYENTNLTPHPNIMLIQSKNKEIKIDQIREAINFLTIKSQKGKVLIIEKAENLNTESANALLKTLEEPPLNTLIILTTSNQRLLLPTIVSRLKKIRFRKLSNQEIKDILSQKTSNIKFVESIVPISEGSLCIPMTIMNKENIYNLAKSFYDLIVIGKHEEGLISLSSNVEKLDSEDVVIFFDIIFKLLTKHFQNNVEMLEKFINEYKFSLLSLKKGVKKKLVLENLYFTLTK